MNIYRLSDLTPGHSATVLLISPDSPLKRRYLELGLIPDTKVTCVASAPTGDPKAFLIRGAVIAIRNEDSADIKMQEAT